MSREIPRHLRLRRAGSCRPAASAGGIAGRATRLHGPRCGAVPARRPGDGPRRRAGQAARGGLRVSPGAASSASELRTACEAGVDDVLSKPLVHGELLARLRAGARELELERRLGEQSGVDPLTKLASRQAFAGLIDKALAAAQPEAPVACLLLELDFFSCAERSGGRAAGDAVLVAAADRLRELCAGAGGLATWSAGQFAAVLPGLTEAAAVAWAEQRCGTSPSRRSPAGERPLRFTLSAGVAAGEGDAATSAEGLLQDADEALARRRPPATTASWAFSRTGGTSPGMGGFCRGRQAVQPHGGPRRDDALPPDAPRRRAAGTGRGAAAAIAAGFACRRSTAVVGCWGWWSAPAVAMADRQETPRPEPCAACRAARWPPTTKAHPSEPCGSSLLATPLADRDHVPRPADGLRYAGEPCRLGLQANGKQLRAD